MGRIFTWLGGLAVAMTLFGCAEHVMPDGNGSASSGLSDGTALSESEVASLLRQAGFPSNVIGKMVCTATYESSLNPNATNHNSNGSTDYGLFQINSVHLGSTPGCPSSANALFDPLTNTQCAYGVYQLQGINAWVAYRSHPECASYQLDDDFGASTPTAPTAPSGPGGAGSYGASPGGNDPYGDPYATGADPYSQGPSYGGNDPYGNGTQGGGPSYGGNGYGGDPYAQGGGQGGGYQNTGYGGYGTDGMSDFSGAEGDEDCDPYTGQGCGGSGGNVIIWYF